MWRPGGEGTGEDGACEGWVGAVERCAGCGWGGERGWRRSERRGMVLDVLGDNFYSTSSGEGGGDAQCESDFEGRFARDQGW